MVCGKLGSQQSSHLCSLIFSLMKGCTVNTQTVSRAAAHALTAKRLSIPLGLLLAITNDLHIQQAVWAEAFSPRSLNRPGIDH